MKKLLAFAIIIALIMTSFIAVISHAQDDEFFEGMNVVQNSEDDGSRAHDIEPPQGENPDGDNENPGTGQEPEEPGNEDDGYIPKKKLPTSEGIEALRGEFDYYQGPYVYGVRANDYALFDPRGKNDTHKYPLIVYVHGAFHGLLREGQLNDSDFPYWASEELQSRFDEGGAFIMLPRSTGALTFWDQGQVPSLKAAIDDVIANAGDSIDTSKIVIMGSSDGGAMVRKMICRYPTFFCGALTLCQTGFYSGSNAQKTANIPIWLIACKKDFFVLYSIFQVPMWNTIRSHSAVSSKCRFTSLDELYYPDGSKPTNTHNLARVASYDLQLIDGSDYPYEHTVDGDGRVIDIHPGNGIIAWINEL
jgi:predicted esterase